MFTEDPGEGRKAIPLPVQAPGCEEGPKETGDVAKIEEAGDPTLGSPNERAVPGQVPDDG